MKILENLSKLNKEKVIIKDNTNLDKNIKLSDENEDKKEKKKMLFQIYQKVKDLKNIIIMTIKLL